MRQWSSMIASAYWAPTPGARIPTATLRPDRCRARDRVSARAEDHRNPRAQVARLPDPWPTRWMRKAERLVLQRDRNPTFTRFPAGSQCARIALPSPRTKGPRNASGFKSTSTTTRITATAAHQALGAGRGARKLRGTGGVCGCSAHFTYCGRYCAAHRRARAECCRARPVIPDRDADAGGQFRWVMTRCVNRPVTS